jgi:hypothetical protein
MRLVLSCPERAFVTQFLVLAEVGEDCQTRLKAEGRPQLEAEMCSGFTWDPPRDQPASLSFLEIDS